jgi:UDP-N-acetylmuramoyl-L-alanyl-D-glutamate--2,6-diaminopimelate ligase
MSVPAIQMESIPTLTDLLSGFADAADIPVSGIASDSRQLKRGYLFLACAGISSHGVDYLREAKGAGVAAVAWDSSTSTPPDDIGLPMIAVENLATHLGEIANRFYGNPSTAVKTIGVTGTNGKTTVAWLLAKSLHRLDKRCGYLGTLGFGLGDDDFQVADGLTTPAAIELHGHLADFAGEGASHAAIEVSSHALSQGRVDGVQFEAALFTNLTRDHLDYHGDMKSYFESKARLFLEHPVATRIINLDSEFGTELAALCGQDVVTVSTKFDRVSNGRPYVFVRSVVANERGSEIAVASSWGDGKFLLPLPGEFNVANAAIVLAYLLTAGVAFDQACDVLQLIDAPPGRMQRVPVEGRSVYIDYAHTPNAIESALRALRPHCRGKLWCVFGCGGDRDSGKRPLMGKFAERLADNVVITTDNPRSEDPAKIIDETLAGFSNADSAIVIEDRATAIAWTVANANSNDVVLIAGKGHEDYQEVAGDRRPLSDYALALAAATSQEGDA